MEFLLKKGSNPDQKFAMNRNEHTLHAAMRVASVDLFDLLLKYGADVRETDLLGNSNCS